MVALLDLPLADLSVRSLALWLGTHWTGRGGNSARVRVPHPLKPVRRPLPSPSLC